MEKHTKKQLENKITIAISETELNIESLKDKSKPISPDNAIGRLTRMDAIGNKCVNEASLRNAQSKLTKLKIALANIDRPDFGICFECEEEIPMARIMVMPESNLCVKCTELNE